MPASRDAAVLTPQMIATAKGGDDQQQTQHQRHDAVPALCRDCLRPSNAAVTSVNTSPRAAAPESDGDVGERVL